MSETASQPHLAEDHSADGGKMSLMVGDEMVSSLSWRRLDQHNVDIFHTFTPPKFRGSGYAHELVKQAAERFKERELDVHASCWYAHDVLHGDD